MKAPTRIVAVGDIMLGDHPVCFGHGVMSQIEKVGLRDMLSETLSTLDEHDVVLGNLECVLSDIGAVTKKLQTLELRGKPSYAGELAASGFNALCLANNHILQHGVGAFDETVRQLTSAGIAPLGTSDSRGKSVPKTIATAVPVTCLAFSLRPEQYASGNTKYAQPTVEALIAEVREVAKTSACLVVSLHWGNEYLQLPSPDQRRLGRALVDAGARIVVGHHPHVVQPVEEYREGLIAYSLGNFLFDSWREECRASVMLSVEVSESGIDSWKLLPLRIGEDMRVRKLHGAQREQAMAKLTGLAEAWRLAEITQETPQQYAAQANAAEDSYQADSYRYFLRNVWRYPLWVVRDSLMRALRRRLSTS